jgi:hypothetical protein
MAVSGRSVAYTLGGFILVYSGWANRSVKDTLTGLLSGHPPAASPAGAPTIGVGDTGAAAAAAPAAAAPANASEKAWIAALMLAIGAPPTAANINSMASWIAKEGPWPPRGNNPLNTSLDVPGAQTFNSAGVKNYATAAQGIAATASTLTASGYPTILAALRSGKGICGPGFAADLSKWSGGGYSAVC